MSATTESGFRVLFATDDSESARHAEAWLGRARWRPPCTVDVLCVASHGIARLGWTLEMDRSAVSQAVERLRESEIMAAERTANEVGLRLQAAGLATRAWARQGEIVAELLAAIELDRPDLVAIGPRGRSGLADLLLGSVSRRVVAESRSAVLVARTPRSEDGPLPDGLLVLVDGTRSAEDAIDWLLGAGWAQETQTTLLGLLGVMPGVEFDDPELVSQVTESLRNDAMATLDRLADRLVDAGCDVDMVLKEGHPHEATMHVAQDIDPDAIVVTRPSGRRTHDPFAEKVARYAKTSVLVVPET